MSKLVFTDEELIIATVASLKKWKSVSIETVREPCGFCYLIKEYEVRLRKAEGPFCEECPATDICSENTIFWLEIDPNPRKSFNPGKFKYQQRRIQKNIDWLNDYLKESQE